MTETNQEHQILTSLKVPSGYRANDYVYVMANDSMEGIYKIGMTKGEPEERAKELSCSTGVPTPFYVVAAFNSENSHKDEKLIHDAYRDERVNEKREFFKTKLPDLLCELSSVIGPERNEDVSETACTSSIISFRREAPLDVAEELCECGLGYISGSEDSVRNYLIMAGIDHVKKIITETNSSIVLMPDGSIALVKPYDIQHWEAIQNERC